MKPAQHTHNPDWVKSLRDKGLRATTQRLAVLNFLHHHPHTNAENIFQGIQKSLPTLSVQTVHLIVQDLTGKGLIRRISLPDSPSARYETRIEDNHHHIQCIKCGRTEDVDCVVGHAPCLDPSHTHEMRILEASIIFHSICRDCDKSVARHKNKKRRKKYDN